MSNRRPGPHRRGAGRDRRGELPIGTGLGSPLRRQGRQRQPRRVRPQSDEAWAWLDEFLTVEQLRELLPEAAALRSTATGCPIRVRSTS